MIQQLTCSCVCVCVCVCVTQVDWYLLWVTGQQWQPTNMLWSFSLCVYMSICHSLSLSVPQVRLSWLSICLHTNLWMYMHPFNGPISIKTNTYKFIIRISKLNWCRHAWRAFTPCSLEGNKHCYCFWYSIVTGRMWSLKASYIIYCRSSHHDRPRSR